MLIKRGSRFDLYPWKVNYTQHGQQITQWALPSKEWWENFEQKWEHTTIQSFEEVTLTEEQLQRYEEVKFGIPESFASACVAYILEGTFPEGITHPLRQLEIKKQQDEQDMYLIDQDFRLSLVEMGVGE